MGYKLSDAQLHTVVGDTLRADHLTWSQANHLPVGYKATLPTPDRVQTVLSGLGVKPPVHNPFQETPPSLPSPPHSPAGSQPAPTIAPTVGPDAPATASPIPGATLPPSPVISPRITAAEGTHFRSLSEQVGVTGLTAIILSLAAGVGGVGYGLRQRQQRLALERQLAGGVAPAPTATAFRDRGRHLTGNVRRQFGRLQFRRPPRPPRI
jgi:hypothetical protein